MNIHSIFQKIGFVLSLGLVGIVFGVASAQAVEPIKLIPEDELAIFPVHYPSYGKVNPKNGCMIYFRQLGQQTLLPTGKPCQPNTQIKITGGELPIEPGTAWELTAKFDEDKDTLLLTHGGEGFREIILPNAGALTHYPLQPGTQILISFQGGDTPQLSEFGQWQWSDLHNGNNSFVQEGDGLTIRFFGETVHMLTFVPFDQPQGIPVFPANPQGPINPDKGIQNDVNSPASLTGGGCSLNAPKLLVVTSLDGWLLLSLAALIPVALTWRKNVR